MKGEGSILVINGNRQSGRYLRIIAVFLVNCGKDRLYFLSTLREIFGWRPILVHITRVSSTLLLLLSLSHSFETDIREMPEYPADIASQAVRDDTALVSSGMCRVATGTASPCHVLHFVGTE